MQEQFLVRQIVHWGLLLTPQHVCLPGSQPGLLNQNFEKPLLIKKPIPKGMGFFINLATRKGLEPSTSGVTGRHSNQLNYRAALSSS